MHTKFTSRSSFGLKAARISWLATRHDVHPQSRDRKGAAPQSELSAQHHYYKYLASLNGIAEAPLFWRAAPFRPRFRVCTQPVTSQEYISYISIAQSNLVG